MKGGDTHGLAIKPGNSAESPLIRYVAGLEDDMLMPPKGDPLTPAQIGLLRAWIDQGAVWPESASAKIDDPVKDHWAFQPVRAASGPGDRIAGDSAQQIRNPIDAFVAAKLAEQGLTLSPRSRPANAVIHPGSILFWTVFRRRRRKSPRSSPTRARTLTSRLVDRLLASPRYGECWGRHWLDVIPFGETHGFEVNTPRENAWPYRDYVIQAFNRDTPYPRFILEQLAGDTVGVDEATGFVVAAGGSAAGAGRQG